jgi:isochorismate hydrolase
MTFRRESQSCSRRRTPANFNAEKPSIDPANAIILLIDHQSGFFQTVGDILMSECRDRASALAKIAKLSQLPVITPRTKCWIPSA